MKSQPAVDLDRGLLDAIIDEARRLQVERMLWHPPLAELPPVESDHSRLILADWLDDRGAEARASFIRWQIKLWQSAPTWGGPIPTTMDSITAHALSSNLLVDHGETWSFFELVKPCGIPVGGPERWLSHSGIEDRRRRSAHIERGRRIGQTRLLEDHWAWSWDRGFISSIACSWRNWERYAESLMISQPIIAVDLLTWPDFMGTNGADWVRRCRTRGFTNFDQALRDRWPMVRFNMPASSGRRAAGAAQPLGVFSGDGGVLMPPDISATFLAWMRGETLNGVPIVRDGRILIRPEST